MTDRQAPVALIDVCVRALARDTDRAEVEDILRSEQVRRSGESATIPLDFGDDPRDRQDRCHFAKPDAGPGRGGTLGEWIRQSAVLPQWGRVLYRIAREAGGPILEIGTGSATSTAYLATGLRRADDATIVTSLEPNAVLASHALDVLAEAAIANVEIRSGSQEALGETLARSVAPRVVHIDSDHRAGPLLDLIEAITASAGPLIICLDDIRWSPGMEAVWDHLTRTLDTIDFGLWGIAATGDHPVRTYQSQTPAYLHGTTATLIGQRPTEA